MIFAAEETSKTAPFFSSVKYFAWNDSVGAFLFKHSYSDLVRKYT